MTRLRHARVLANCGLGLLANVDDCPMRLNGYELEREVKPLAHGWLSRHLIAASLTLDGAPGGRWPRKRARGKE